MAMSGYDTARRARQRADAMTAAPYSGPPDLQFRAALARRNIVPPAHLIADGKLHRCDSVGRGGKGDAAYVLHLDDVPAGGFQNWRDGIGWKDWRAEIGRSFSPAEQEEYRRRVEAAAAEREADQTRRKAEAAGRGERIPFGKKLTASLASICTCCEST